MVITLGLGRKSLWMKRTNSFLKRFESSNSTIKHKRSCQSALVGFCPGHCCGPLYEKTSQMWLHYMHTPSWKEKRVNHLQLIPQTGNISASKHYSHIKLQEMYRTVPIHFRGGGRGTHLPCLCGLILVWHSPSSISLCNSLFYKHISLVHS